MLGRIVHNLSGMRPPKITVSLVHIHGPLKGEIQEFNKETISIGRHRSNDVCFPVDVTTISRYHAQIVREGNRFKLADKSANGTFVNGKRVSETFLKDGDVIEFAAGGPKVSFLTEMKEEKAYEEESREEIPPPLPTYVRGPVHVPTERNVEGPRYRASREPSPYAQSAQAPRPQQEQAPLDLSMQRVAVPLVIQYGPFVRSYKEVPVTIGRHPKCGFVLDQPGILNEHVQIFYLQNRYWIKDLTGQDQVRVNRQPIAYHAALSLNDTISLGPEGPVFRFIGEGRLAEAEEAPPESPDQGNQGRKVRSSAQDDRGSDKSAGGFFSKAKKKLF